MPTQPHPISAAQSRAEINKQNAQHSTGPRTEAGRQRVRTNALKHGLTAREVFLADGESQRYEALLQTLQTLWRPADETERDLVFSLRDAVWRLNSIPVTEINLATLATEEHMEAYEHLSDNPLAQRCAAQAAAYRANARLFDQLSRHEMRLERTIRNLEGRLGQMAEQREQNRAQPSEQPVHREENDQDQARREYLQRVSRQQEEQVAAYLAAKREEATKQSQPATATSRESGNEDPSQPRTESAGVTSSDSQAPLAPSKPGK